jgi:hypothetical protein
MAQVKAPRVVVRRSRADPDPNPGIGGYTRPRGPKGEGGYPGSTSWTRENPQAAADRLHNAPGRPAAAPPFGRPYRARRTPTVGQQQANVIPAPAHQGGLPYQGPHNGVNPARVRDTERRPRLVISKGIPGGQRQRNTVYRGGLAAVPGATHTYRSAPKGRHFPITEVQVPSRYVFGGVNGGTDNLDDLMTERRMPYTGHVAGTADSFRGQLGHARGSVRGAVLDGTRFTLPAVSKDTRVSKQGGAYGRRARGHQRHRPTIFAEPAPRTAQFYDTNAETGSPDAPGRNSQIRPNVYISPRAARGRPSWGSRRA